MVKRSNLNRVKALINKDIIKVLIGVRWCGKSYMFNLIIDELINRGIDMDNIILINFESTKYNNVSNSRELELLIENLTKNKTSKLYMFFDEIQKVDKWEKSINGFRVDYDCDIYIMGFNSKLLAGELADNLTGRFMIIKMFPFSFKEFLDYKKLPPNKVAFNEYLTYGGFPFVLSMDFDIDKTNYLNDLFNSIISTDILTRYNIHDVNLLIRMADFTLDNVGKIISSASISNYLWKKEKMKVSPKTIYNYLEYLTNACLLLYFT